MKTLMIVIVFMSLNARADMEVYKKAQEYSRAVGGLEEQLKIGESNEAMDKEVFNRLLKKSKSLYKELESDCPKDAHREECTLFFNRTSDLKKSFESLTAALDRQDHDNSAEGIYEVACEEHFKIIKGESIIRFEKEVGKTSGVVDMNNLRIAGAQIVESKSIVSALKVNFRNKFKKEMKPLSTCPTE